MSKKYTVLMWFLLCLPVVALAGRVDAVTGQHLFEQSGCTGCHSSTVEDAAALKGLAQELPMRSRILTKLRTQGAILQDREMRFGTPSESGCLSAYANFAREYRRVFNLILQGNPVAPMPAWQQRTMIAGLNDDADHDDNYISEIIDFLLMSENQTLEKHAIARWKASESSCASAANNQHNVSVGDKARRDGIYSRLEFLDKKMHAFDSLPSIAFLSYQTHLLNQVAYLEDGDLDIWILRQAEGGDINYNARVLLKEKRFPNPLLFFIVVDKKDPQYRAYFFKQPSMEYRYTLKNPKKFFIRESVRNPNHLVDADAKDCFSCHSSGPLRLRPRQWDGLPDFTAENWKMIEAFNQRILTYGPVLIDWPASQSMPEAAALQPVQAKGCQGCHQSTSIRAPLLRYHKKAIVALMNAHEEKSGYYEYGLPNPDITDLFFGKFQTQVPSISRHLLPAMPPLGPLTEQENAELFNWLGVGDKK